MKKRSWIIGLCLFAVFVTLGVIRWYPIKLNRSPINNISNESLPVVVTLITPVGSKIAVRVADDPSERELGLSYFKTLPADQGMLFLFDQSGIYPFWMKGMNFPLDIIWLKRGSGNDFQVVYVAENVDPSTYPNLITPSAPADTVLEINSGRAKELGIAPGVILGR